jgi:hypothetical protein
VKWLLTISNSTDTAELDRTLKQCGAKLQRGQRPIPLEPDEQVVHAEGPDDLPERLKAVQSIRGIHPASDMELY